MSTPPHGPAAAAAGRARRQQLQLLLLRPRPASPSRSSSGPCRGGAALCEANQRGRLTAAAGGQEEKKKEGRKARCEAGRVALHAARPPALPKRQRPAPSARRPRSSPSRLGPRPRALVQGPRRHVCCSVAPPPLAYLQFASDRRLMCCCGLVSSRLAK